MTDLVNLTKREISILLGCLNDASGYPYQKYEAGVKEKSEDFVNLYNKIYKAEHLESNDLPLALLALKQTYLHMDQRTLFSIQDDVTLDEVGSIIANLESKSK